ncbi:hypothetical protein D3C86_1893160 [compost metagenome]
MDGTLNRMFSVYCSIGLFQKIYLTTLMPKNVEPELLTLITQALVMMQLSLVGLIRFTKKASISFQASYLRMSVNAPRKMIISTKSFRAYSVILKTLPRAPTARTTSRAYSMTLMLIAAS